MHSLDTQALVQQSIGERNQGKPQTAGRRLHHIFLHRAWRHPADHVLSEQIIGYWTNFARSGDPDGPGLPQWSGYDQDRALIHLDDPITAGPDATRAEFLFLVSGPQPQ